MLEQSDNSRINRWILFTGLILVLNFVVNFLFLIVAANGLDNLIEGPIQIIITCLFLILSSYLLVLFINRSKSFARNITKYFIISAGIFVVIWMLVESGIIYVAGSFYAYLFLVPISLLAILIWSRMTKESNIFVNQHVKLSILINETGNKLSGSSLLEVFGIPAPTETSTVQCKNCGKSFPDNHKFCRACGKPLH